MPFKDLPEGQTHYENDGCGEPAHNPMTKLPEEVEREFDERFVKKTYPFLGGQHNYFKESGSPTELYEMELIDRIKSFLAQALANQREELARQIEGEKLSAVDKTKVGYLGEPGDYYNYGLITAADLVRGNKPK